MFAQDFKSCGSAYGGPVGSIPTHFRQLPFISLGGERWLSAMISRKPKPFRASKEVKRQARMRVGAPPPVQRHESRKSKAPKHKKQQWEETMNASEI